MCEACKPHRPVAKGGSCEPSALNNGTVHSEISSCSLVFLGTTYLQLSGFERQLSQLRSRIGLTGFNRPYADMDTLEKGILRNVRGKGRKASLPAERLS